MKKAQIQFDYIVAFFIFLILIFISAYLAFEPITKDSSYTKEIKVQENAKRISELLIKTKGLPENWENGPENLERLGLASEPWVLDSDKITALSSLNYSQIKDSLDIDYQFILKVQSNSTSISIGDLPNDVTVAIINRYAILGNETATVTVGIW